MTDTSLIAKIDAAIGRQQKYVAEIADRIANTDSRRIDQHVALRHERQAAERVLANLQREKLRNTPVGGDPPIRRKRKIRGRNSHCSSARAVERHSLSVYSGTIWLGLIEQVGDQFTAKTIKGKKIGIFGNLKLAAGAISDTAEAAA
jgi:hypothetical protein